MAHSEADDLSGLLELLLLAVLIVGCSGLCYVLELYKLHPAWGSKLKHESDGNEVLRINQMYIHGHVKNYEEHKAFEAKRAAEGHQDSHYGSVGSAGPARPPLWGECEAPWQRREKVFHPELGEVTIKHHFTDTQWLRRHSTWWPRDELHCNREIGVSGHPLTINDEGATLIRHQMGSPMIV